MLRATPSFGDGMRVHADDSDQETTISDAYRAYLNDPERIISVQIEWGDFWNSSVDNIIHNDNNPLSYVAEFTVHGIGRRPGYQLIASKTSTISRQDSCLHLHWPTAQKEGNDKNSLYPEYLVELCLWTSEKQHDVVLRRVLHVLPPLTQMTLPYSVDELFWAPFMSKVNQQSCSVETSKTHSHTRVEEESPVHKRRRGFGIELETIQLPPNADAGYFTAQEEFVAAVARARHSANINSKSNEVFADDLWDRLLLWNVERDPEVENAAPPARLELYSKVREAFLSKKEDSSVGEIPADIQAVLLLGKPPLPEEWNVSVSEDWEHINQASPEYKSPPPPNELFHEFPYSSKSVNEEGCFDNADTEIYMFLDQVLKNPVASTRPLLCPTVSIIGQSASSIHVHVNVRNPKAWPRKTLEADDLVATQSLLCVLVNWVRFDLVAAQFTKPWMRRDRSFAPMFASGPEFLGHEVAWTQGTSALARGQDPSLFNFPKFFRHAFETYNNRAQTKAHSKIGDGEVLDGEDHRSLFDRVFDDEIIRDSMYRRNSLNLVCLKKYGTVEFRRMHGTLDPAFISAWSWFCVGFVEKYSDPGSFARHAIAFFDDAPNWWTGLGRLIEAQNKATMEDLLECMQEEESPYVPPSAMAALIAHAC